MKNNPFKIIDCELVENCNNCYLKERCIEAMQDSGKLLFSVYAPVYDDNPEQYILYGIYTTARKAEAVKRSIKPFNGLLPKIHVFEDYEGVFNEAS